VTPRKYLFAILALIFSSTGIPSPAQNAPNGPGELPTWTAG